MRKLWRQLRGDDRGATAIEYGLLVAIISLSLLLSARFLADEVNDTFDYLQSNVAGA